MVRREGPPWYETLFGDVWLDLALTVPPERTRQEVEFIVGVLELPNEARLLDLACGHGRHALELAKLGYRVTGVDLSEVSLARAREGAERAGLEIEFVRSDMREIDLDGGFDAVINIFTAFGYYPDEAGDEATLRAVARALRPGGFFLIDTINHLALMRRYESRGWQELDDGTLWLDERRYDTRTGRNEVRHLVIRPDGSRKEFGHSVRLYTFPELSKLLERAELTADQAWGDFDSSEYSMESPRMIVRARKA